MTNLTATTLWVLSDLHLAPPGDLCQFHAHERLVGLLDHIGAQPGKSRLILNGDIFDFLQLPGYDAISLPLAPARMGQILDALADQPPARDIVAALAVILGEFVLFSLSPFFIIFFVITVLIFLYDLVLSLTTRIPD